MPRKRIEPTVTSIDSAAAAAPAKAPITPKVSAKPRPVSHRRKTQSEQVESSQPVAKKTVPVQFVKAPCAYTHEDIAIRAYLIAESRGFQSNPESDWLEAEGQLAAERVIAAAHHG